MNTREKELIRLVRDAHSNLISLLATVQPGEILHAKTHELLHEWLRARQKELRRIESSEGMACLCEQGFTVTCPIHGPSEQATETCKDCDEAAAHAYSDATSPGFFSPKCKKHREKI